MELTTRTLPARKHIALVAHDHCKQMLMSWVERHQPLLEQHVLYATGTTAELNFPRDLHERQRDVEWPNGG